MYLIWNAQKVLTLFEPYFNLVRKNEIHLDNLKSILKLCLLPNAFDINKPSSQTNVIMIDPGDNIPIQMFNK